MRWPPNYHSCVWVHFYLAYFRRFSSIHVGLNRATCSILSNLCMQLGGNYRAPLLCGLLAKARILPGKVWHSADAKEGWKLLHLSGESLTKWV